MLQIRLLYINSLLTTTDRLERHADGMFNKAYRKALGQLSARKYLHTLMAKHLWKNKGTFTQERVAVAFKNRSME
uniref:Glucagon / GIP / secretin / VIP family domain-containing protein n=1 Tax=Cyprinus carpio TaxID=7962 RepID=A0A8C1S239_CYPCA